MQQVATTERILPNSASIPSADKAQGKDFFFFHLVLNRLLPICREEVTFALEGQELFCDVPHTPQAGADQCSVVLATVEQSCCSGCRTMYGVCQGRMLPGCLLLLQPFAGRG